jgi:guanylate kinase
VFAYFSQMETMAHKKIIIITAPSGAGKTSITHFLLNKYPQLAFSISAATRAPRGDEKHGEAYYFITADAFQTHIKNDEFLEWEMVYEGKYYGTLKSEIERIWGNTQTPVLDIDVRGAMHIKAQNPANTLTIFIEPPSIDTLRKRLESRGTETKESIATRVNKASYELSFKNQFDEVVMNVDLQKACWETEQIIASFLGWK